MPSTSKKQAHLMSAIAHGWKPEHPRHKMPPLSVAQEFHEADKEEGKWEHAEGGSIGSPLDAVLGHLGFSRGLDGPSIPAHAYMHMPRVPIADTLKRIDTNVKVAKAKLPKMRSPSLKPRRPRMKFAAGGSPLPKIAQQALTHVKGGDASMAAAFLRASPIAMRDPMLAAISEHLQHAHGVGPATAMLTKIAGQSMSS